MKRKNGIHTGKSALRLMMVFGFVLATITGGRMQVQAQGDSRWITIAEESGFTRTPRYAETISYCRRLAEASQWVKYATFGRSPQGRDLPLLIINRNGHFTPDEVRKSGQAVVLIQSCIHAGECDGKDASLMLLRDMVIYQRFAHLLENVTLLVIPIFNVDGHEMFGPFNRFNQNGPEETGYRATAQYLNLNRDFLKADAPEMRAWLSLFHQWLPDFLVDNHVTDGYDHQYALTYGIEKGPTVAEPVRKWTAEVMEPFLQKMMAEDGFPIFPYFRIRQRPDIQKGIAHFPYSPRYSTGYGIVQNRIFFLVETHALKDYRTRVVANYHLLKHIIALVNSRSRELMALNRQADEETALRLRGTYLPLQVKVDMSENTPVDFLGVKYSITQSDVSGGQWVHFEPEKRTYRIPFYNRVNVVDSVQIPHAYLLPPQWQQQLDILKLHGVRIHYLQNEITLPVESYRFSHMEWAKRPFEGRLRVNFEWTPIEEERTFPRGTAVILMNQRTNRVIAHLLEPHAPDSFLRWGFWNTIFERKEYAEDYKLEDTARQMLAENPSLWEEFQQAVASDSVMASNHWARLYFFYARTPYWEQHVNVYPVARLMQPRELPLEEDR